MRIIDKQHDFYDYLQDPTDIIVFDRRGSFLLTKEEFCEGIKYHRYYRNSRYRFVVLQCGVAYWLFLVTITAVDKNIGPVDYDLELLADWKNYNGSNELIKLDSVDFFIPGLWNYRIQDYDLDMIRKRAGDLKAAVNRGDYHLDYDLGCHTKSTDYKGSYKEETQKLPILKACGVADFIDPVSIFCAIEEHFSMVKTASETTEAKGATNEDKVIMHGFDVKTSFRKM